VYRAGSESSPFVKISGYQNNSHLKGLGTSSVGKEYQFIDATVQEDKTYWYKISDVDYNGKETFHNILSATVTSVVLEDFRIEQNYPNPFNPVTTIKYNLPAPAKVTLSIYNIAGERVATLINGETQSGLNKIVWDARNFSSGIYYYEIKSKNFYQTRRMVLLK
jgi:hypothetical protein